jgi:hypothetical protein
MTKRRLTVVIDEEQDADILAWWARQANKSAAVRRAIRAAMGPESGLTVEVLRRVLREELAGIQVPAKTPDASDKGAEKDADPELAARLDTLF